MKFDTDAQTCAPARLRLNPSATFPAMLLCLLTAIFLSTAPAHAQLPSRAPDRTMSGKLVESDSASYKVQSFQAPAGVHRMVVALGHDGDPKASLIEIGIADPIGFRGASSKKPFFTIAETDATPGYFPGRLPAGVWKLNFSVGQLPRDKPLNWTVRVWFLKAGENLPTAVKGRGAAWYRGDMHIHSGHSDGFCASQSDEKTPCPLYNSIVSASARELDFVMLTEHNTTSQAQVVRELQPAFDRLLLIPGQEVTTFYGHINVWGVDTPIDYRVVPGGRGFNDIADDVHRLGGLLSVNHPAAPTGAMCLGCGWTMPNVDYDRLDAVEVVNGSIVGMTGGNPEGPLSALPFWLDRLASGFRPVAVGGSDTHDGKAPRDAPSTIGRPATVVYAADLTQAAIIAGLRSGRVFVDVGGNANGFVDLEVSSGAVRAQMGGSMVAQTPLTVRVETSAPPGSSLELMDGRARVAREKLQAGEENRASHEFTVQLAPGAHAIRAQVRGPDGRLLLISNAVMVQVSGAVR